METTINIENKKLELIQWISTVDDAEVIDKMLDMKNHETHDWWLELSEAEKQSIERGLEDAEAGRLIPHEKVRAIYAKYL